MKAKSSTLELTLEIGLLKMSMVMRIFSQTQWLELLLRTEVPNLRICSNNLSPIILNLGILWVKVISTRDLHQEELSQCINSNSRQDQMGLKCLINLAIIQLHYQGSIVDKVPDLLRQIKDHQVASKGKISKILNQIQCQVFE